MNPFSLPLSEALEIATHQLLFHRGVYPKAIFEGRDYLGVRVHTSRHPALNAYISKTCALAGPTLTSGTARDFIIQIIDEDNVDDGDSILERWVFNFDDDLAYEFTTSKNNKEITPQTLKAFETSLRNLILQTLTIQLPDEPFTASTSFKLILKISNNRARLDGSKVVYDALCGGEWFQPDASLCEFSRNDNGNDDNDDDDIDTKKKKMKDPTTKAIKNIVVQGGGISCRFVLEKRGGT